VRVLFVSSWFPYPPDNGSRIRIYNLLRALSQRHEVTLITFADPTEQANIKELKTFCHLAGVVPKLTFQPGRARAVLGFLSPTPRSLVDTHNPQMARLIQQELDQNDYHAIVACEYGSARYVARVLQIPKILEDVETGIIRDAYGGAPNRLARFRAWLTWAKMRRYVRGLVRQFDACTVVSEQERACLKEIAPEYDRVTVIPNGVDVDALRVNGIEPQPNTLVYNGALTYSANYDAMRFFLDEIWHRIKSVEPSTRLQITGRTDGVDLSGLALGNGAGLTGYLPDIRPTVASAWICVVPLRLGGGTRLKILEAMALGTPVIATRKGAEGLDVTAEENILIADDPADFATQTIRLLRDPALRKRLAENARRLVEAKYSWRAIGEQFNQLVEAVALRRTGG
jgi:sugar transferase (PEP-CTERM/EpsH1 system associated)